MCVIAVSQVGIRQPNIRQLQNCFWHNPHGAGYMTVRDGKVEIHKGFMTWADFSRAIAEEHFTVNDPVVYHFRISTQGGINPGATHPFPLTSKLEYTEALDVRCSVGIAHNGIIRLTSDRYSSYSDTQLFVAQYMPHLVRRPEDITNPQVKTMLEKLTESKLALMNSDGHIELVGRFLKDDQGRWFSNSSYSF